MNVGDIRSSSSDGSSTTPVTNRRNLLVLGFALFVVTLGFGVVMPIIPFYMERLGAGGTELPTSPKLKVTQSDHAPRP